MRKLYHWNCIFIAVSASYFTPQNIATTSSRLIFFFILNPFYPICKWRKKIQLRFETIQEAMLSCINKKKCWRRKMGIKNCILNKLFNDFTWTNCKLKFIEKLFFINFEKRRRINAGRRRDEIWKFTIVIIAFRYWRRKAFKILSLSITSQLAFPLWWKRCTYEPLQVNNRVRWSGSEKTVLNAQKILNFQPKLDWVR